MDAAKAVTATFDLPVTLTVVKSGSGSGTVTADTGSLTWNDNTGTASYAQGAEVTLTASADSDSIFTSWTGACSGNTAGCLIQMTAAQSETATFSLKADFSGAPVSGSAPLAVSFTDGSVDASSWLWDFGDGETSALQNPVHMYKGAGSYTVSLTANGATTAKEDYITVGACSSGLFNIGGSVRAYTMIKNAYESLTGGATLQIQAVSFSEELVLEQDKYVVMQGGYGCDFSSNPGFTTIQGSLTVSGGTVKIENMLIK
jgi:PKD repeat protein